MPPLEGITVVSLEQAVAAPFCTRQLADYGARVIKIERPGVGDFARAYDERVRGLSSHFVWVNRSKESLTLDVKQREAAKVLHMLISRADVLVQNLAPGAAARLGLDADTLRAKNPRLIVCDIAGYGADGPYRDKKAYDLLIQSEAGWPINFTAAVPVDDTNMVGFTVTWLPDRPLSADDISIIESWTGAYAEVDPVTFEPVANRANDYLLDRERQRSENFTGMRGIREEDIAVQEDQFGGPITDRTKEHLGTSDAGVIALRRRLLNAVRNLQRGHEPVEVRCAHAYRVHPTASLAVREVPFETVAESAMPATVASTQILRGQTDLDNSASNDISAAVTSLPQSDKRLLL